MPWPVMLTKLKLNISVRSYHDIEWFALDMNRDHSVAFEIASKYCISDSFVDHDDHYIYYCGHESLRRNGVAIMVNKRVWNAVLGCNLKNDRMISVCFQGKPFNITVIQVYAPTSNTEEAEIERFYEDFQGLLEITPKKDVLFIIGDWNAKVESQEIPGVNRHWPQDWKRSVFFPIPKKGNIKECSIYLTIAHISHSCKVILKILH